MSMSAPSPPDPYATANAQQGMNENTAKYQAETNMVNQTTPYGSLNYNQTGANPDGSPIFSAATTLNPAEQNLFNTGVGTQTTIAGDAGALAKNLGSSLTQPPNLGNSALTGQMMDWQNKYMQPIFNQQQSNLNSQLAAQGIGAGSDAYDNAQNLQSRNVNNAYEGAMAQDVGQAFNQAATAYQLPIQTLGTLLGESQPGNVSQSVAQTPQESIQPANLESLVQQNYQSALQNYGNTMSGMFSIPSALLGGWARSGFATPSDARLKKDIARVGFLDDGTPVYRFRYRADDRAVHIGLMAQDVRDTRPDAISYDQNGFMLVDYARATDGLGVADG